MAGWTSSAEREAGHLRCMHLKAPLRQDVGFYDQEIGQNIRRYLAHSFAFSSFQDAITSLWVASVLELTTRFVFAFGVRCEILHELEDDIRPHSCHTIDCYCWFTYGCQCNEGYDRVQDLYSEVGTTVEQALGSIRMVGTGHLFQLKIPEDHV
ncbi:hypothetical protein R1sor_012079 [Riccia sorocarpa]|uniref:Uncharacterized protein n=1 Tax=Riccia sorocarpa TaxID=122646 RepID=A0ABD3I344_9MARC